MATFYNKATLSYNGNVTDSNITTGEIVEVLSASKNAVRDSYGRNDMVTYVVNFVNSGDTNFTDLTLTDDLGRYRSEIANADVVPLNYVNDSVNFYVNGVKQETPTVSSTSPLTIEGLNVPAKGNASVVYNARTNDFAPLGENAVINNTVNITGNGILNPVTAAAAISHANDADLDISKSLNPAVVPENGTVTYTFTILNNGSAPAEASDNVIFRDVFNPVLNISSVTFNGTPWTRNTEYTYTDDGTFTSTNGSITVPAATYTQNPDTGAWAVNPGVSTLIITGSIAPSASTPPTIPTTPTTPETPVTPAR